MAIKLYSKWLLMVATTLTALTFTACSDEDGPTPTPDPTPEQPAESPFNVSISGIITDDFADMGSPVLFHSVYMRASALPADEEIIGWGSVISSTTKYPTLEDSKSYLFDVENMTIFSEWDWSEDLYYRCGEFNFLTPGTDYYVRGYVKTTVGEYYTEPTTVRTEPSALQQRSDPEYVIPIVFNVFPDSEGRRIPEEWLQQALEWGNIALRNSFGVDVLTDTGIELELADLPGLDKPGFRYFDEPLVVDTKYDICDLIKPEWRTDISKAVNIWVAPVIRHSNDPFVIITAAFTDLPIFTPGEELIGCNTYRPLVPTFEQRYGIVINSTVMSSVINEAALVHEMGHFLGLEHMFIEDYCDDTYPYDRLTYMDNFDYMGYYRLVDEEADLWEVSTNAMDYFAGFQAGFTPQQKERMHYTLQKGLYTPYRKN